MPYHRSIRCITLVLPVMFAISGIGARGAELLFQRPTPGVLVLRNDNVLSGMVQRTGTYFSIQSDGATLQIPASQVEMACESLTAAYEQRRRQRVGNATDAHLQLARWCLRHGLLAEAAREILDVRTDDPGHPAIRSLELQLQQALADDALRRQREQNAVVQAMHSETAPPADAVAAPLSAIDPTPEVQEQFVRSIQPMLVHGCTTSGCHTPGSKQAMQLDRWALEGSGIPALIRKNLDHALAQIDPDDPMNSPLMRRARQAHGMGNQRQSIPLAPYQTAVLIEWLNTAAGVRPELDEPAAARGDAARSASGLADGANHDGEVTDAMIDAAAQELLQGRRNRTAFTPRDPFDPEIFNRRSAGAKVREAPRRAEMDDEQIPDTIELPTMGLESAEESADLPAEEPSRD
jgi:hypothetical protein